MFLRYLNRGLRHYSVKPGYGGGVRTYEFQCVLNGRCWPDFGDGEQVRTETPCLWVFPYGSNHIWLDDTGAESEVLVAQFREVPDVLGFELQGNRWLRRILPKEEMGRLRRVFEELFHAYGNPTLTSEMVFQKGMLELALLVLKDRRLLTEDAGSRYASTKVQQAIAWYEQRIHHGPTVEEVAAGVMTSASNLRRYFRVLGRPNPHAVFHEIRMNRAQLLLRTSTKPLEEIADDLGFSELSAFSRAFQKYHGKAPSRCRELGSG